MIDVVSAVTTSAAVETPTTVDGADSQLPPAGPTICFSVGNLLAGILRNLASAHEVKTRKAAFPLDG